MRNLLTAAVATTLILAPLMASAQESTKRLDEAATVLAEVMAAPDKGIPLDLLEKAHCVVIVPDLHREPSRRDFPFILDRHKGLTVRIPDGRGQTVRGALFNELRQRNRWREEFESMRLLYVAATRAEDRLILSGAVAQKDLQNLTKTNREQWLAWIWQALELDEQAQTGRLKFGEDVHVQVTVNREPHTSWLAGATAPAPGAAATETAAIEAGRPLGELFPLLRAISPERDQGLRRFSVTQLINFQRCTRQYYFDRMLKTPGAEERAVWNDAEAPEPPANLTATLKGAVIHRFCETFVAGDDAETRLRQSFEDVRSKRQAELAGRAIEINPEQAVRDLLPLARNYLASEVFQRVTAAHRIDGELDNSQFALRNPQFGPGLWSELRFRLRRPLGILTGTIDKLLITQAANGLDVEIIDFKTNRFRPAATPGAKLSPTAAPAAPDTQERVAAGLSTELASKPAQRLFNFETVAEPLSANVTSAGALPDHSIPDFSIATQLETVAHDYQLQMQSYALALRELLPANVVINSLRATLHFIDPKIEISLPAALLEWEICEGAIDEAISQIATLDGTLDADLFPPLPAAHCRICNFLELCPAGREWLSRHR